MKRALKQRIALHVEMWGILLKQRFGHTNENLLYRTASGMADPFARLAEMWRSCDTLPRKIAFIFGGMIGGLIGMLLRFLR